MVDFVKLKKGPEDDSSPKKKPQSVKIPLSLLRPQRRAFSWKRFFLLIVIFFLLSSIISSFLFSIAPKIAVVGISGVIVTGSGSTSSTVGSRDIIDILNTVKDDNSIKGVVLDINSPGGSPVASEEISNAIDNLKIEKPVYAVFNDVGASGAFWVGVSSDKLYASKMSLVGSIGVTSAGLGFENFIERYNITYRRNVAGAYKDMGSPFKEPTDEENEMLQDILDDIHLEFINHVADSRNMSVNEVKKYANGEVFLGSRALDIGFVDAIGNYEDVLDDIKNITEYDDAIVVDYSPRQTLAGILGFENIFNLPTSESLVELK